jgi:hypothetical protein
VEKVAPSKEDPSRTVAEADKELDLGAAAKKVNEAETPHKAKVAPALSVVLFGKLDKDSAKKAEEELGKVKGVDAKETKAYADKGEISVRIKGSDKVKTADLVDAAKKAGVEVTLTKGDKK